MVVKHPGLPPTQRTLATRADASAVAAGSDVRPAKRTAEMQVRTSSGRIAFLLRVARASSRPADPPREREAAGEHERTSEAGGGSDAGIAPAEAGILDVDDERLRPRPRPWVRRRGAGVGDRRQRAGRQDREGAS